MAAEEQEVTIEIVCRRLPGIQCDGRSPIDLGIQHGEDIVEAAPADRDCIVFRPGFRVRQHTAVGPRDGWRVTGDPQPGVSAMS